MTEDQFALWLLGYITISAVERTQYQKMGRDVLEAARCVGATVRLNAGPPLPVSKPQPGDLDYEDTSCEKP